MSPRDHVLPLTDRGERYASYSRAVRDLVRPRLLENRLSYRLVGIRSNPGLELTFGSTTFFEAFDVKQSIAHEFKAAWLDSGGSIPGWQDLPLRSSISDRPTGSAAVSQLVDPVAAGLARSPTSAARLSGSRSPSGRTWLPRRLVIASCWSA
jgi:hypothetical protein